MAPNAPQPLVRRMFGLFGDGRVKERPQRLAVCSYVTWRTVMSTDDLSEVEIKAIVQQMEYWKSVDEIEYRCRRIAEKMQEVAS